MKYPIQVCEQIQTYQSEDAVVSAAIAVLTKRMRAGDSLSTPKAVRDFLRLTLAGLESETFWMISLDNQNRVIAAREMFRGTISQTSVYPREVVKQALADNAAVVILAHNHPSGVAEPSQADVVITSMLKQALALVDVRVIEHFVVAGSEYVSFTERGLL